MSGIEIRNLTVRYGDKFVFEDFDIDFAENKINVILGGSGVGKTTLLNCIASLKDHGGEIIGNDGGISYIFQKDRLIPSISIYKNLDLVLKSQIKDKADRKVKIENMLSALEISDQKNKFPSELSGGQLQRAALARAYLYESRALLLDEPFKALDTALKTRLLKALVKLENNNPRTVIFVTHAIDECLLAADKYIVLSGEPARVSAEGEITVDKESRSLTCEELDPVRHRLLQAVCAENTGGSAAENETRR